MYNSFFFRLKNNDYFYFILKLLLFFLIVFVLDFSIGKTLNYFYFKQTSGLQYRTTYSIEKATADVLIFGSSRANHHYDPEIIEKQLNLSYYNVGRDGNFILYHYAVLKSILKRNTPKIVILDFVNQEFKKNQESYDRLSCLLPYYRTHPEIRPIIELKSPYEKMKLVSSIYPFNSSIFTIAIGNAESNKTRKQENKGYIPLSNKWNKPLTTNNGKKSYEMDSVKISFYKEFITDCLKSNIKLYIICSPYYIKSEYVDSSIKLGEAIAKENHIDFFNFATDSTFLNHPALFADINHLNHEGAKKFTNKIIEKIVQSEELTKINKQYQ